MTEQIEEKKLPWPFLWSKISLGLSISAWLLILVCIPVTFLLSLLESIPVSCSETCIRVIILLSPICAGCAFLSGITSTLGFIWQKIKISSKITAFGGLTLSASYLFFIFIYFLFGVLFVFSGRKHVERAHKVICNSNMKIIALGFESYHENNNSWPNKENWCDVIKPYVGEENDRCFRCSKDKAGPCSYAMNKNIPADAETLPDDLVILFEAAPGWNQVGGPDDVVTDRHKQPGANIAFAAGRVEFIDADNIPNLRWTIDNKNKQQK